MPKPKLRSQRWLSTSIPESDWNSDLAHYCSAEYHTNNLLSPVLFEETSVHIPKNAVVIEIAPHGLLQPILKKSLRDMVNIPLTQRVFGDSVKYLLTAIGKWVKNQLYLLSSLLKILSLLLYVQVKSRVQWRSEIYQTGTRKCRVYQLDLNDNLNDWIFP